ncbi:DUF3231 family protein [Alkalihalobacterium bogoriense]|uniref:DUF3231 family protein n=1 Tax=Alkalihalobacterium bogoriense TaxID=246272 RepID=UPI00047C3334|nr:DUF3231 family protein [Alkalihalobacterium bogoriense]
MDNSIKLSSSELATLWTTYTNDCAAICMITYFLQHIDDNAIKEVVNYSLNISEQHTKKIKTLFNNEKVAIPKAFSVEEDVILSAPRLYSDSFYLFYLHNMAKISANSYSLALANAARSDVRQFYSQSLESSITLYNKTADILLEKGLYLRPPQIPMPEKVDFVKEHSFLTGWFGERRPLNAVEIMNLFFNIERNQLGKSLIIGFSQTSKTKEIIDYFLRGKEIARKHVEVFSSILNESELPAPMTWDTLPTNSTTQVFSEKLMMFHITALQGASISHYGTSMGTSLRRDIGLHYNRLLHEVLLYAEDGSNLLIKHGWLEQPPQAPNRQVLVHK